MMSWIWLITPSTGETSTLAADFFGLMQLSIALSRDRPYPFDDEDRGNSRRRRRWAQCRPRAGRAWVQSKGLREAPGIRWQSSLIAGAELRDTPTTSSAGR